MVKTRAIVINQRNINDHDSLVSFYTLEFGKISLLARGLKRPSSKLAGHLDYFNLVDLMIIKGRERDYVGSAISENSFLKIKEDYNKIIIAGQGIRFLSQTNFPNQYDFDIFLLLRDFLLKLDNFSKDDFINRDIVNKDILINNLSINKNNINSKNFKESEGESVISNLKNKKDDSVFFLEFILLTFKAKLLSLLGYNFDFSNCFSCGKKGAVALNFFKKELWCADCIKNISPDDFRVNFIRVSQKTINLKKNILESSFFELNYPELNRSSKKELTNLIDVISKII